MKRELCRFDHAVTAIEVMQVYVDTCGRESNTKRLLEIAHDALHELEELEEKVKSRRMEVPKPKPISAPLERFNERLKLLDGPIAELQRFLDDNGEVIIQVQEVTRGLRRVSAHFDNIKATLTSLRSMRRQLGQRAALALVPVAGRPIVEKITKGKIPRKKGGSNG